MPIDTDIQAMQSWLIDLKKEFQSPNERGFVLVCGSFIERWLMIILQNHLVENDLDGLDVTQYIFDKNGVLGTFSSKIQFCYALGLISDNEYKRIETIRKIRNSFAHEIEVTLQTQKIKDLCKNLKIPAGFYIPTVINLGTALNSFDQKTDSSPKELLYDATRLLYDRLACRSAEAMAKRKKHTPLKSSGKEETCDTEYKKAEKEIENEQGSDRGLAALCCAHLDFKLRAYLEKALVKVNREWFEGQSGVFSSFSSKITLCYLLGLLGQSNHLYLHIQTLRHARNESSHNIGGYEFTNETDRRKFVSVSCSIIKIIIDNISHLDKPTDQVKEFTHPLEPIKIIHNTLIEMHQRKEMLRERVQAHAPTSETPSFSDEVVDKILPISLKIVEKLEGDYIQYKTAMNPPPPPDNPLPQPNT